MDFSGSGGKAQPLLHRERGMKYTKRETHTQKQTRGKRGSCKLIHKERKKHGGSIQVEEEQEGRGRERYTNLGTRARSHRQKESSHRVCFLRTQLQSRGHSTSDRRRQTRSVTGPYNQAQGQEHPQSTASSPPHTHLPHNDRGQRGRRAREGAIRAKPVRGSSAGVPRRAPASRGPRGGE